MSRQPMSMEAMLDEERREILAILEAQTKQPPKSSYSGGSPLGMRSASPYASPRSPVRSMLDVVDDAASISSMSGVAGIGGKKSPPRALPMRSMLDVDSPPALPVSAIPVRSMLDIDSPPPTGVLRNPLSGPTSPVETSHRAASVSSAAHPRSFSDTSTKPTFGPRSSASRLDPTSEFQFGDIITTQGGQTVTALPKRNTQRGKKQSAAGVMADVMRGADVGTIPLPGDPRGRHHSIAVSSLSAMRPGKSKSPHNRLAVRSSSPSASLLSGSVKAPNMMMLDDGTMVDMNSAYRKLSDANLVFSGSSLAQLPGRKRPSLQDDGSPSGRLAKDYFSPDGEEMLDSSEEDQHSSSEEEGERGRKPDPRAAEGSAPDRSGRKTHSLLAAAEEERALVESQRSKYQYRSLLEPEITVTNPSGERVKSKPGVHPTTNYDYDLANGNVSDANESENEHDLSEIKQAQKMSFSMTPIIQQNEHHRAIRMIYRGEYQKVVKNLEDEHQRIRKYLVATDISDESTHALEWAIGTVLRDGDTLLAIYCVDEETGIVSGDGALVADDPKAMKETAAHINSLTSAKSPSLAGIPMPMQRVSALSAMAGDTSSQSMSPSRSVERNKGAEERQRAVKDISDRVTRLLRKTQLQVRVVVEVIHCKNPKHMITEIIDYISPTLVILGSRGRSALKGVILGSFSNYLVTKSSVPVMVARKRLKKHGKYKRPDVRQVNNLSNPTARSLTNARID